MKHKTKTYCNKTCILVDRLINFNFKIKISVRQENETFKLNFSLEFHFKLISCKAYSQAVESSCFFNYICYLLIAKNGISKFLRGAKNFAVINYQSLLSVIAFLENMKSCYNNSKHRKSITKNINNFLMLLYNTLHLIIIAISLVKVANYQYCQGLGWEYQFTNY